jgi:Asp-tRNA(Asn)/Glu-tRNA(Gln) amidotransferase A subunit family amidase
VEPGRHRRSVPAVLARRDTGGRPAGIRLGLGVPPAPEHHLVLIDARTVAAGVRSGGTSAVDVVTEALVRAREAEQLNAFTRLDPDGALDRARRIDAAVAAGEDPGVLAGVSIALKDLVDQAGIPTTAGSSFLREPARQNAPVVDRLEAAGAVIIGRTGLHEFAYGFSSENDWFGPVRNPWDPGTSPGGSSGGSATAVAAGIAPIGIGTDTGGSVRVPAALCGLVGLKVTHGRISLRGVFPLGPSLDTVGPITTTVADAALVLSVLAGHDPDDPWSRDEPVHPPAAGGVAGLRVGVPHPWVDRTLAAEQEAGFATARAALEDLGATVIDLDAPGIDERDLDRFPGAYHEVAGVHREWFSEDPTRYGPAIRGRLAPMLELDDAAVGEAARWRAGLTDAFEGVLIDCDLLLTPSTAARSKPIGEDLLDIGAGPEPYRPVLSWFTPLVNQAGLPAIALPIEDAAIAGLPPSIQLIGRRWGEAELLGAALTLEEAGLVARRTPPHVTRGR